MSKLLEYMQNANHPADVYIEKASDDSSADDSSSSEGSGFLSGLRNFLEHPFQGSGTVIAPNYTPRPLDDSVYSDIPGTPVASGQFGELEDESVRDERMKDSADYMAANWPRLYGGVVAADEGLANVVGGIQNAVGGGNGILTNVQRAEEGMQDYRDQWNNTYGDSYFLNPNKFATDAGSVIGSSVPIMAFSGLMPGAAVAGGTRALTSALSRAGLGRLAMSKAGQALIADTVRSIPTSNLADSLSEYGTVVNDMMQNGMSEDEARRRAIPMFFKNMALDTFTVPLELGVMKGGKGIATGLLGRSAGEGVAKSIAKGAARTGLLAGASGLTEGYQEGAQNALENDVQGKRDGGWYNPFTWTNEDWEAARGGFVGGALMGIPGNVAAGFHPEARQAPLSAEAQEQAQGIKDTLSHGKPDGMSNAAYNAYIELANSGNPDLIKQAASSLKSFQQSQEGSQESTDDAATEAYKDYETYDQKQEIENFLNNNTVEQIGGEDNFNWLYGVLRNGTPEEVQQAYDTVIAAEKATAEQEAKNRPASGGGSMSPNTGNAMANIVIQAANDSGVDPRLGLAIAARESGGDDVNAISMPEPHDGIYGIMQAQEETVSELGLDSQYPDWKTDPYQNAMVGMAILKSKIANENGDVWAGVRDYNGAGEEAEQYRQLVKNNYDNMGDIGGGGGSATYDGLQLTLPDSDEFTDQSGNVSGLTEDTRMKLRVLDNLCYQKFGQHLIVSSSYREGDPNNHGAGVAFDVSGGIVDDPDARQWLEQAGPAVGLFVIPEYQGEAGAEFAHGDNVHFSNVEPGIYGQTRNAEGHWSEEHAAPSIQSILKGGASSGVSSKAAGDNGKFERELDQAAQEAKSDMDKIQAQSDQAMNEIMNDDSAEKTAQDAQQDAESAQKQAEESQQSAQDDVVPDVAQTIRDTSNNIDEINTLDGMFTKDGNGNDKFIDTPENRDYIKTNYKDEIDAAVKKAMQKTTAPKIKTQKKEDLPIVDGTSDVGPAARFMKSPHARLGNILADYDRNDPKFKGYMETFRHGTDEQQAQLADQLQQAQEQAKANSTTSNATVTTPSPANPSQQAVQAPKPAAQVNTPTPTQTAPKKAPKAQYEWGMRGYHWSGELNDKGKINIREADMSMYDSDMQFDVAKIQKAIAKAKTEEEARGIIRNIAKNTYGAHVERLRMKIGGNASVEEWRTKHKESPEIQEVYDDLTKGLTNLYEQATGKTLKEQFAEKAPTKAVEAPKEKPTTNNTETPKETPQKEKVEEKKGEVKHEENKGNNVNTKPQQAESKDTESADAEKGAESNVQEEVSKFHDLLNSKKSTPRQVVDAYKRIADAVVADAKDNPSKAKAGEKIIVDNHDLAVHSNNFTDVFIKRRLQREITAVYDDAHKELRAIMEYAGKEEIKNDADIRFGTVDDAEKAVMEAFGVKPHKKPADTPAVPRKASTKATPKKAVKKDAIKDDDKIEKTFHLLDDSDEALEAEKKAILEELSHLSANPAFNPTLMYHLLKFGAIHVQRGLNEFARWAKAMKDTLPQSEPFLQSVWASLQSMPNHAKLDEKQLTAAIRYVGSLYDHGMTDKVDLRKSFIATLGVKNAKYFDAVYNAVMEYPSIEELKGANDNVNSNVPELVARSGEGASENAVGESRIQGGTAMRGSRQDTAPTGKESEKPGMGHDSIPGSSAATGRTAGNRRVQTQESKDSAGSTGSTELPGSVRAGLERVPDDDQRRPAELVRAVENRPQHEDPVEKVQEEQKDKHLNEIKKALPMLLPQQAEDVCIAEDRFKEHSGMMFTNGTGTGKTYTGLGIVKRFVDANKKNILIIAPSDGILKQWEEAAAKDFGITLTRLNSTKDAGKGAVTATYANVGANQALVNRDFDLVITDESHNLMGSESATPTDALKLVRAVTGHKDGFQRYHHDKHPEISSKLDKLHEEIKKLRKRDSQNGKAYNETHDPSLVDESREIRNQIEKLEEEQSEWHKKLEAFKDADEKAFAEKQPSKVLFLSATPFQYVADLDYANGYLFNYSDYGPMDEQGYNRANGREIFYMENFGYKMRYNRLERPSADVDTDLMEREFNRKMVESGAMHGRMLSSAYDYDRGFIRVDAGIGKKIDEGFDWLRDQPKYSELSDFLRGRFTGQQKYYLLEAIKAKQAIPLIKEYLKEGKKVVIFHNFNKGGADNPFAISREGMDHLERLDSELADHILEQYHEFQAERPDLAGLDLNNLESPIETLSKAFGDELALYNGTLSKGEREKNKNSFNNDDSKTKIILVQSAAGQAGVSLHDTTGKYQRALINLGLPTRPSEAIQQEGRIYRVGNKSNAIFRYLNTGTYMEQTAFATKLAERAGTVENIALGEMARSLKQAYVEAFEESQESDGWKKYLPGSKTEGTGGKANDYRQEQATDFDRAKAVYFGKQKKNSRTKSQEGHDYFATPEPIGYKMVQWLQAKPGQSLLEPSAGDGAIARWMPDNTYNTVVEPSRDLTPKLMRNVAGAKVVESTFENFDLHNKFDGIAMNPPFGKGKDRGGKLAMEHVAKAYKHLKDGGRLIAIIPDGPACQKRFDKWFYGTPEAKRKEDRGIADGVLMADIHLPSVTFEREGTNVNTRMVVIDKYADEGTRQIAEAEARGRIDIAADDANELFDIIEDMNMPERLDMSDEKKQASIRKAGQQLTRSKEDLKAEIKEAFPNAKEIKDEGDRMTFTMPNGSHIVVDVKNEILLTDEELAQAKKDHHIDDNGNVVVEGYAEVHGKDAYMALAQGSREGTGFHEAYHLSEGAVLTDREKTAIKKAIPDVEKRADKYAEWVEARKRGRGTAWGKLFQKIKDFAAKMKKIFTGAETVNDVFRQIESGEVWERGANNSNQRGSYSVYAKRKLKEDMQAFAKKIDDFMNHKLSSNEYVRVMDTPLVFDLVGEKHLPIYISPNVLNKILNGKHHSEISSEMLKEIPRRLADPMFILRAINHRTGVEDTSSKIIVIDLKDKNGATIMIPFIMEQQTKDDEKIMSNLIKSVYGRTTDRKTFTPNDAWYLDKLKKGDALYVNKKRTDHWLTGINTSARTHSGPLVVDSFNLSNIIADETDLGKLKKDNPTYYSIREQDQKISNEAKKRFMNHIEVARKQADENAIGVHRTLLQSPSRIAEKKKYFKPFFKMADDAMNLLTKLRADYQRRLDSALDLSKKDKASLQELLWSGDMEGKEYTREELREQGYNEQVIDSYWKIRNLFRKAYNQLNETRKQAKTKTGHFSGRKLDELRHNKFVEILRETDQDDGSTLVSYKEYGNWQAHYLVNEDELKSLENDDNIQILEKVPTKEGPMDGQKHWKVITREGVPDIHDRKGYVPHFFHEYMVRFVDSHGKATVVSSGRTISEATKNAIKWQAENEEMLKKRNEGDWKITISPKVFDFGEIGLDESKYATTVGDKDFYMMEKKIADKHSLTLHEAKEMLDGMVKKKGRHRFFGNFLRRTGADGYEQEIEWVLRHYFNSTSRYVAMESKFKPQAISLFERLFGRFDNEYHGLPNYIKEYINDINGNPSTLEKQLNDLLNAIPAIGKWVNAHVGDRAAVSLANSITNKISIAKLGFLNVSSAMLNILQIANAAAYTGNISTLWKALLKGAHRKYSLHDLKILRETNVLNDIGLDSGAGYGKFSAGKWANRGMILFKESEGIVRRGVTLAAYETARKRGRSHEEAIRYAKDVNRKSNFDYGVHDAPGIFRRGSIFSQIFLQFKKYPIKQLEAMKDFLPFFGKGTTKKQKAIFWGTYFAMAGLFQIPFANILGLLIMGITGDDPEKEAKKSLIELAENYPSLKPLAKIGMYGIGTFANIDITSRVGIGDAVPDDLQSLFGPAASTLFNVAKSAYSGDNWTKQVRNVSPGLGNLLMAAQGNSVGKRGRVNQEYTTPYQRLLRGMGFQSTDESDSYLIQSILSSEKKKASSKKQQLIDEYIANPTGENARKLKNAGIKPSTVKAEQKKKKLDTKGRTESSMNKNDKKQYQYLLDW